MSVRRNLRDVFEKKSITNQSIYSNSHNKKRREKRGALNHSVSQSGEFSLPMRAQLMLDPHSLNLGKSIEISTVVQYVEEPVPQKRVKKSPSSSQKLYNLMKNSLPPSEDHEERALNSNVGSKGKLNESMIIESSHIREVQKKNGIVRGMEQHEKHHCQHENDAMSESGIIFQHSNDINIDQSVKRLFEIVTMIPFYGRIFKKAGPPPPMLTTEKAVHDHYFKHLSKKVKDEIILRTSQTEKDHQVIQAQKENIKELEIYLTKHIKTRTATAQEKEFIRVPNMKECHDDELLSEKMAEAMHRGDKSTKQKHASKWKSHDDDEQLERQTNPKRRKKHLCEENSQENSNLIDQVQNYMPPPPQKQKKWALSNFKVEDTIGSGTFGEVMVAIEKRSGIKYAIKKVALFIRKSLFSIRYQKLANLEKEGDSD